MELQSLENIKYTVKNCLLVGMSYDDSLVCAGAMPRQIDELAKDEMFQRECRQAGFLLEKGLLEKLNEVIDCQVDKGKESAITWLLGKVNPRYKGEEVKQDNFGNISINLSGSGVALENSDTVSIFDGTPDERLDIE